ncbi:MAG: hypothetical protein ACI9YH_003561 [Colwellia sp.]|jgi:hypothetical protein
MTVKFMVGVQQVFFYGIKLNNGLTNQGCDNYPLEIISLRSEIQLQE